MKNDITDFLLRLANKYHIDIDFKHLDSHTPPATNPENKLILMNNNWHNQNALIFQLAHELGHVIGADSFDKIVYFSPCKYGIEKNANKFAIDLLLPSYIRDKNTDNLNYSDFMDYYSIPYHLEELVIEELNNYIGE